MDASSAKKKYGIVQGSRLNHPMFGVGSVKSVNESGFKMVWDSPYQRIVAPNLINEAEVVFMTKVISEEKKMPTKKKAMLEFEVPDDFLSWDNIESMPNGEGSPLATMDGNASAGQSWSPSLMDNKSKETMGDVKVASGEKGGKVNVAAGKSSAPSSKSGGSEKKSSSSEPFGGQKAEPFKKAEAPKEEESESEEKDVSEMSMTWSDLMSLQEKRKPGFGEKDKESIAAKRDKTKEKAKSKEDREELEEDDDFGADSGMDTGADTDPSVDPMQDAGAPQQAQGISVDEELLKAVIGAAASQKPAPEAIDKMVAGFVSASAGGKTLTMADAQQIMGGAQSGGDMGGDEMGSDMGGDATMADDSDLEGKDPLMDEKALAQMSGKGGQQFPNAKAPSYIGESRKGKTKKEQLDEAWMAAIPSTRVIHGNSFLDIKEDDDDDTAEFKLIAYRAGVKYKGN